MTRSPSRFRAQAKSAGLPGSEHAIHFCLALGFQAAWALSPGDIVFERPSRNRSRADLRVREPHDLMIEVKYLRSVLSGSQPARPMHYGQLLADFNKLAQVPVQAPANRARGRRRIRPVPRAIREIGPHAEDRGLGINLTVVSRPAR